MYIHPLNEDQAETLIDKLLARVEDKSAKDIIQSFIGGSRGYVRKNGFMATNPMLLTIMVNNYEQLRDFNGDRIRFYDLMYKALIRGHDEEKESFGSYGFSRQEFEGEELVDVEEDSTEEEDITDLEEDMDDFE